MFINKVVDGESNLNFISLILLSCLIFGLTASVYGYLTGSTFFSVRGLLLTSPTFDFVFLFLLVFAIYGVATFSLHQYAGKQLNLLGWLLPAFSGLLPVFLLVFELDWGQYFRIYVAPTTFYLLVSFSVYSLFFLEVKQKPSEINSLLFVILTMATFGVGVVIYLAKNTISLVGNFNFAMQFLLSMLCVVLPVYFALMIVRLKLLE